MTRRGTGGGGGGGDGTGGEGGGAMGIGDLKTSGGAGNGSIDTGAKTATKIVARVKSDDIEAVDGKIDKKSVQATIRRRQDGFLACYEAASRLPPMAKSQSPIRSCFSPAAADVAGGE